METLLALIMGIGLSAACGFRVFVPLLVVSIASYSGHLTLSSGFEWLGSEVALATFSVATLLEVGGYFIPWLDNLLDTLATPAAVMAGTIITASVVADISPFLQWTLAAVAGGGTAAAVQSSTVLVRGASTAGTGGLGNPVFATAELGGSAVLAVLAVIFPIAAFLLLLAFVVVLAKKLMTYRARRMTPAA
jgi:hypothetical protein